MEDGGCGRGAWNAGTYGMMMCCALLYCTVLYFPGAGAIAHDGVRDEE